MSSGTSNKMKRGRFVISGHVQGVCFRMCAADVALQFGVTGWVRNRHDGTVEIVAEGETAAMADFLAWCRHGPSHAHVTGVAEEYTEPTGEFTDFEIRH